MRPVVPSPPPFETDGRAHVDAHGSPAARAAAWDLPSQATSWDTEERYDVPAGHLACQECTLKAGSGEPVYHAPPECELAGPPTDREPERFGDVLDLDAVVEWQASQ